MQIPKLFQNLTRKKMHIIADKCTIILQSNQMLFLLLVTSSWADLFTGLSSVLLLPTAIFHIYFTFDQATLQHSLCCFSLTSLFMTLVTLGLKHGKVKIIYIYIPSILCLSQNKYKTNAWDTARGCVRASGTGFWALSPSSKEVSTKNIQY